MDSSLNREGSWSKKSWTVYLSAFEGSRPIWDQAQVLAKDFDLHSGLTSVWLERNDWMRVLSSRGIKFSLCHPFSEGLVVVPNCRSITGELDIDTLAWRRWEATKLLLERLREQRLVVDRLTSHVSPESLSIQPPLKWLLALYGSLIGDHDLWPFSVQMGSLHRGQLALQTEAESAAGEYGAGLLEAVSVLLLHDKLLSRPKYGGGQQPLCPVNILCPGERIQREGKQMVPRVRLGDDDLTIVLDLQGEDTSLTSVGVMTVFLSEKAA